MKTFLGLVIMLLSMVCCTQPPETKQVPKKSSVMVTDYGIVADSPSYDATNTAKLRALVSPAEYGGTYSYTGEVVFPGGSTYYFNNVIPVKDDIHIDLDGSTLHFSKTLDATDLCSGFVFAIRDFSIRDGNIVVDIDNPSSIKQAGSAIMLGSRWCGGNQYYFKDLYDSELSKPMGDISIVDVGITTSHHGDSSYAVLMFGGLKDVHFSNVTIDASGLYKGIAYEFGHATDPRDATDIPWLSSHASDMVLEDISIGGIRDYKGTALTIKGAYDVLIDGLYVNGGTVGIKFDSGEAAFFHTWENVPDVRLITLKNIHLHNIAETGMYLGGSTSLDDGYLSSMSYTDADQVDLLDYNVSDFFIEGPLQSAVSAGVYTNARKIYLRDGFIVGFRQGFLANEDITKVYLSNIDVIDSQITCVSTAYTNGIYATPRLKTGYIENSYMHGCGERSILINNADGFDIEHNMLGAQYQVVTMMENTDNVVVTNNTVITEPTSMVYVCDPQNCSNKVYNNYGYTSMTGCGGE